MCWIAKCPLRCYLVLPPTCQACAFRGAQYGCTMPQVQSWMCGCPRGTRLGLMLIHRPITFTGQAMAMLLWSGMYTLVHQPNSRGRECKYLVQTASRLPTCLLLQHQSPPPHLCHPSLHPEYACLVHPLCYAIAVHPKALTPSLWHHWHPECAWILCHSCL